MKHVHTWTRVAFADTKCQKISVFQQLNELCSDSQERKFWGRTYPQKNFSYCSLLLQTGTIVATVRDSHHNSNDLLQGGLEDVHYIQNILPNIDDQYNPILDGYCAK